MLLNCNNNLQRCNAVVPPKSRTFDWNDIPVLLALARDRRMRAASRRLGLDTSTLSRRLAAAEKALQVRLFVREPGGYKPTEAGSAFLKAAALIDADVRAMLSVAREASDAIAGTVRLTSVDLLLDHWLMPRLPALIDAHPSLDLRLMPNADNLSFSRGEADLALRIARPREDAALLMRRVGKVTMAVYAGAKRRRLPRARWAAQPWLSLDEELDHVVDNQWLRQNFPGARPRLRSSSSTNLVRACEEGLGLALLPCFAAHGRSLVRWSDKPELYREIWLLSHRDTARQRRFRVVADWLIAQLKVDQPLFTGP